MRDLEDEKRFSPENDPRILFPEFLTRTDRSPDIAAYLTRWLTDPAEYAARVDRLTRLRERIAGGGASARGAVTIVDALERRPTEPLPRPHYLPAVPEAGKMAA